jgi:hypothetical protein
MHWYLHGCPACGGDLYDDPSDKGWVSCFMCARSFRAKELQPQPAGGALHVLPQDQTRPPLDQPGMPHAA